MYQHIGEELEKQEEIINELCEWCKMLLTELSLYRETSEEEKRLEQIRKTTEALGSTGDELGGGK